MLTYPTRLQEGPFQNNVFHSPLECSSERCWSKSLITDVTQAALEQDQKERTYSGDKVINRSLTVPVLQMGKTEAQRGSETCQVSRKISERVSPKCQQSGLSSAQGRGQAGGNLLDDF